MRRKVDTVSLSCLGFESNRYCGLGLVYLVFHCQDLCPRGLEQGTWAESLWSSAQSALSALWVDRETHSLFQKSRPCSSIEKHLRNTPDRTQRGDDLSRDARVLEAKIED